jgi:HlyD family secretion protein
MSTRRIAFVSIGIVVLLVVAYFVTGGFGTRNRTPNVETYAVTRADLNATVSATGVLRSSQSANAAWQTSGQILGMGAQMGTAVTKGQVLATLDPSSLSPNLISARADLTSAQQALQNLQQSDTNSQQAWEALQTAQKAYDSALGAYFSAMDTKTEKANAELVLAQNALDQARSQAEALSSLPATTKGRQDAQTSLSDAQQRYLSAETAWNAAASKEKRDQIAQAEGQAALAASQLSDARRAWQRVSLGPNPDDVAAAKARVDAITSQLDAVNLRAPISGVVTQVNSKVGDEVAPGTVSLRIDDLSQQFIDLLVTEVDIAKIAPGQNASINFDALPGKTYSGTVTSVGKVGQNIQGVVNFTVTVELQNGDANLRPGLTAAVDLTVDHRSAVLVVPVGAVRYVGGQSVVFVWQNGKEVQVPVTVGLTTDTQAEIASGNVHEGDAIVLNPSAGALAGGASTGTSGGGPAQRFPAAGLGG